MIITSRHKPKCWNSRYILLHVLAKGLQNLVPIEYLHLNMLPFKHTRSTAVTVGTAIENGLQEYFLSSLIPHSVPKSISMKNWFEIWTGKHFFFAQVASARDFSIFSTINLPDTLKWHWRKHTLMKCALVFCIQLVLTWETQNMPI